MSKPSTRKSIRRGRFRILLELDQGDDDLLSKLVVRYQKVIGEPSGRFTTSSKVLVIRQIIRHMAKQKTLPEFIDD